MQKKKAVILEGDAVSPGDLSWDPVTSLCDTIIYGNTTETTKWDRLGEAEIVLTNKVVIDEAVFARFPQIRYVGVCATGYNVVDLQAAGKRGIPVTNVPAYSTPSVAQHVFALLLDLTSKITLHDRSVRAGDWIRSDTFCYWKAPVVELAGKTMGIFGYGAIGRSVSEIALALGMNVIAATAHPEKYEGTADRRIRFVTEDELFAGSDVISLHCPLTEKTHHLIHSGTIRKMKDGVILINTARGALIKEQDLAEALQSGKILSAGLDVLENEPMREDCPLNGLPNVLITPHIAWASAEARTRLIRTVADNVFAWMEGRELNVVNREFL